MRLLAIGVGRHTDPSATIKLSRKPYTELANQLGDLLPFSWMQPRTPRAPEWAMVPRLAD